MSAVRLKKMMEIEDLRIIDIASNLRINPRTVTKYLRGEPIHRSIQECLERYLDEKTRKHTGGKVAAG